MTRMTRFEQELNGMLGDYWQKEAERELAKIAEEIKNGKITIDENGVAYNCIGRVLMDDMAEKVAHVDSRINLKATEEARLEEVEKSIAQYREARKNYRRSEEEMYEMRAAFGTGTTVIDLLTGEEITL